MKSILEEFARSNISPEVGPLRNDSEYKREMQRFSDSKEKLLSVLEGEQKETLQQFSDAQEKISLMSGIDRFIDGYRLGVLMTMEVFNGIDDTIFGGLDSE